MGWAERENPNGTEHKAHQSVMTHVESSHVDVDFVPIPKARPRIIFAWLPNTILIGVQWPTLGCGCRAFGVFLFGAHILFREYRCGYCR